MSDTLYEANYPSSHDKDKTGTSRSMQHSSLLKGSVGGALMAHPDELKLDSLLAFRLERLRGLRSYWQAGDVKEVSRAFSIPP